MIPLKNKILEQLEEKYRLDFYEMLENDTLLAIGNKDTPSYYNVIPCGERFLIIKPKDRQLPFCEGRVMSLYFYIPDLRDYAEWLETQSEDKALKILNQFSEQYEPEEVYRCLMKGLQEGTLYNFFENKILGKSYDKESKRTMEIAETFKKGQWTGYVCTITGNNPNDFKALQYPLERDWEKAKRFFAKRLRGINRKLLDELETEKGAEAE